MGFRVDIPAQPHHGRERRLAAEGVHLHGHFRIAVGQHAQRVPLLQGLGQLGTGHDLHRLHDAHPVAQIVQRGPAQQGLQAALQGGLGADVVDTKQDVQGFARGLHGLAGDANAQHHGHVLQILHVNGQGHQGAPAAHQLGDLPLGAGVQGLEALDGHRFVEGAPCLVDGVAARPVEPVHPLLVAVHKNQLAIRAGKDLGHKAAADLSGAKDESGSLVCHARCLRLLTHKKRNPSPISLL